MQVGEENLTNSNAKAGALKPLLKCFANAAAGVSFAALTCAASVGEYHLFHDNADIYAQAVIDHEAGQLHLNKDFLKSHELNVLAFAQDKKKVSQDPQAQEDYLTMIEPSYFGDMGSPFGTPILLSLITAYFGIGARDSYKAHKAHNAPTAKPTE